MKSSPTTARVRKRSVVGIATRTMLYLGALIGTTVLPSIARSAPPQVASPSEQPRDTTAVESRNSTHSVSETFKGLGQIIIGTVAAFMEPVLSFQSTVELCIAARMADGLKPGELSRLVGILGTEVKEFEQIVQAIQNSESSVRAKWTDSSARPVMVMTSFNVPYLEEERKVDRKPSKVTGKIGSQSLRLLRVVLEKRFGSDVEALKGLPRNEEGEVRNRKDESTDDDVPLVMHIRRGKAVPGLADPPTKDAKEWARLLFSKSPIMATVWIVYEVTPPTKRNGEGGDIVVVSTSLHFSYSSDQGWKEVKSAPDPNKN